MNAVTATTLVDASAYATARAELGTNFVRILGYFREDGIKSVVAIEQAMREGSAAALVIPAHTLKGEAYQFGAVPLAEQAEAIEMLARGCVELREPPTDAIPLIAALRPLFEATLSILERESNPLVQRRSGFGKRAALG